MAQDPPHTMCRTQIENFKQTQKGIIYEDPNIKTKENLPLLTILIQECKKYNSPGACYGLFSRIKHFIHDFKLVSKDCRQDFSSLSKVKKNLFEVYGLMVRLAWGDAPPVEYQDKMNWLSDLDISLFCLIKDQIFFFYEKSSLLNLERTIFKQLPGTENMNERRIRELAIVSENCSSYPRI